MIKHSLDSQKPLDQITLSAEKLNRVERNTDIGLRFLVGAGKIVQDCLLFPGFSGLSVYMKDGDCLVLRSVDSLPKLCFLLPYAVLQIWPYSAPSLEKS